MLAIKYGPLIKNYFLLYSLSVTLDITWNQVYSFTQKWMILILREVKKVGQTVVQYWEGKEIEVRESCVAFSAEIIGIAILVLICIF